MKSVNNSIRCGYVDNALRLNFRQRNGVPHARVGLCCQLRHEFAPTEVSAYVSYDNIDTISNHPLLMFYKKHFESKGFHESCVNCIRAEQLGLKSQRGRMNDLSDNNPEYDFTKLDVVMTNQCNLACPFCSTSASSLIEKISSKYNDEELPDHWKGHGIPQVLPEVVSNACAQLLEKFKIHTFKIIGGEPLLGSNWQPISDVLSRKRFDDLSLEITTNGTVINSKILSELSTVKKTMLRISVDSVGKNYEFIRWPHKWSKMESNLLYLRDNAPSNLTFIVTVLVNALNFEFLPEIEKFFNDNNINASLSFNLKPDSSPLQWFNLPSYIVDYVYNSISNENARKRILDYENIKIGNASSSDLLKSDINFYLNQRNMSANSVLEPKTIYYLDL